MSADPGRGAGSPGRVASMPRRMSIDRLASRFFSLTGAGTLVAGRPGMGWLLAEVIPVFVWAQVTGALLGESFYLVSYLTLLGASAGTLALLPLVAYAGNAGSSLLVFARHHGDAGRDAKRRCVVDTGFGRLCWLGTVLWPLLGLHLGWPSPVLLGWVFASIFLAQLCHAAGGSSFVVWTQAVVPRAQRGRFYVWRNCASFGSTALVVLALGAVLPKGAAAGPQHLPWLMGIFAAVTVLCLASTAMLARCPAMPEEVQDAPRLPFRAAFAQARGYRQVLEFNVATVVATAISMAYLPALLHDRGVGTATFAATQGLVFFPAMLGGILFAGWGLGRLGGHLLLVLTATLLLAADVGFLLLPDPTWLAPCLALSGVAKGMWGIALIGRQQELCPAGDARFPALLVGVGALAAMVVALVLSQVVPLLEGSGTLRDGAPWSAHVTVAWVLMAGSGALRLVAVGLLVSRWPSPVDRGPATRH